MKANTAACSVNATPAAGTTGYADVCTGNTPLLGTVYGIDLGSNFTVRAYKQSVFTNTLGGDHDLDNWRVSWRANYTRSIDDRTQPAQLNYESPGFGSNGASAANRLTVAYDLRDPQLSKVELYRTIRNTNGTFARGDRVRSIDDFPVSMIRLRSLLAADTTDAYTARIDVQHDVDGLLGNKTTFAAGLRFDDRTKSVDERLLELNSAAQFTAANIPTGYGQIAIPGGFQGAIPLGYTFQYFGRDKVLDLVERAKTVGRYADQTANLYDVNERVYSAYGMATIVTDWGNVVGGARIEHIRNRSSAFVVANGTTNFTPLTAESDLTLVYPSLHINYDVTDRMKARLSFNTGAARPDYDQLRPNLTYNDANLTISGGNPDAKPEKAMGVDAYVEYYVAPSGFLSFGAYYKRLRDVLFDTSRTFNSDRLNLGGVDRSQYLYSTIDNGGDGSIIGVEGAIQQQLDPFVGDLGLPDWVGGFGVQLNATLNRSRAETPDGARVQLPGASDAVYNLGVYYEKYGFSARVQYQNRSRWLDDLGSVADGGDFYWAKDDELDASLRYAINGNVELFGNFSNLLNGPGRRYVRQTQYSIERETFGRRYQAGMRVNF